MSLQKTKTENDVISDKSIDQICKRLSQNLPIRRNLPLNGRLHIDRLLPFLLVYRRPTKRTDIGTDKFVKGEASYLISSTNSKIKNSLSVLVQNIIGQSAEEHKAFLLLEIWSRRREKNNNPNEETIKRPSITITISKSHFPTETVEALENALELIYILRQKLKVEVKFQQKQWPENLQSLVPSSFAKSNNCFLVGIEIDPFYQDDITGEVFPLVVRKLHQGISRAIKLAAFKFAHIQTTMRPTTYLALGRRAMVKAVWEVDQKLAEISNAFDFLLLVTPINIDQSWNKFKLKKFNVTPKFYYRPIPFNPSSLKAKLYNIPIENIEDPTLANLFYEKQVELERTLSMLRDRAKKSFFYGSMQLYGEIDDDLIGIAKYILDNTKPQRPDPKSNIFDVNYFAARANEELEYYKQQYPEMTSKVFIRDDITGLMVSKGNLLLGRYIKIPEGRVDALIQHEIGTHILTYVNGKSQPFQQLYTGLAGYDELQEGIAVLTEYLVGGLSSNRLRLLAGRVIAANCLIKEASFIDTFRLLKKDYGFEQRIAYVITARVYRGGGLTKDAVYLRGLNKILKYFVDGGQLEPLLIGKISSEHISIIKELTARRILRINPLKPRYLENSIVLEKLNKLKDGCNILELIERR